MSDMVDIYAYHGESIYSSQCIYMATGAVIQRGCKAGGRTFLQPFGNFSTFFMAILFFIYIFEIMVVTWISFPKETKFIINEAKSKLAHLK